MTTKQLELQTLARVKEIAPGYYTERDGGPWYVVTPDHEGFGRVAEGFEDRTHARQLLLWLAGNPLPQGWRLAPHGSGELSYDVEIPGRYAATIWAREARKLFPGRAADLPILGAR